MCCQIYKSCFLNLQVFFLLFAVCFLFGCAVSICSVCVVKLTKVVPFRYFTRIASETLYGKNSFFPLQLKPFSSITQCNCMSIGLCSAIKTNQWHSGGERAYGYAAHHSPPKWVGPLALSESEPIPPEASPLPGHGPAGCPFRKFVRWPAVPFRPHL